jgi:UDP-2-acetamido-3-amino-2,3-dideoxy-glucuronate N-acetyltransferase
VSDIVKHPSALPANSNARSASAQSGVQAVSLTRAPVVKDLRGTLLPREYGKDLPFIPLRYFVVLDVPPNETRGAHAHRVCHEFLVCLQGSVSIVCDDGILRQEIVLDSPELGLHVPPMVWCIQYKHTQGACLLVLASHGYDASDYISDYGQFLAAKRCVKPA